MTIQYDRSQSGLGYNFSSKFIKTLIIERDNVELKITPTGFQHLKQQILIFPTYGSNIDVLDPLNIARLDRFVRVIETDQPISFIFNPKK